MDEVLLEITEKDHERIEWIGQNLNTHRLWQDTWRDQLSDPPQCSSRNRMRLIEKRNLKWDSNMGKLAGLTWARRFNDR